MHTDTRNTYGCGIAVSAQKRDGDEAGKLTDSLIGQKDKTGKQSVRQIISKGSWQKGQKVKVRTQAKGI